MPCISNGTYALNCRSIRYVRPDVVKQMLFELDRCEYQLMTESTHSFNIRATVQSELSYEKQVAAKRARYQELFAQLALSSLVSSFKDKPQQPVAPRKKRQQLAIQPFRKS